MRFGSNRKTGRNNPISKHLSKAGTNLFPAILDTLEDPFFLVDDEFKMTWYNKACNDLYQYVSGKPIDSDFDFKELLTKEQQPVFYEHLTKVLAGKKEHFEWRYKFSVTKWLSVSLYPFSIEEGKIIGICGSLRDITGEKLNELVLRRNTAVLNNISDAVIYTDLEQRVIYFNKNAESIYGIASDEITGHLLADIVSYEYMDDTKEKVAEVISKRGNWEGKIAYTRKDGKKVYMLAAVTWLTDKNEAIVGMIATNKDITQEELNRQQSLHHQANINAIINNIKEGVLLVDSDFTILEFNQMAYTLEKRIDTELRIGENLVSLLPEYRKTPVLQYLELALKGMQVEYEVLYPDNTWLLANFIPVRNKTGNIKQVSITFRDITERKQAEQLISANEKKYRTLVNSISEGVILQTLDNKILTVNKSAERILGLSAEELIQKGFPSAEQKIIDEKEKIIPHEQLFFRKNGKTSYAKNKVIGLKENNSIQWLKLNSAGVSNSGDNEINAVVISFEDITEQKRISGEMEVLSMVAKETNNGVIIFDKITCNSLWVNEGFTRLTGYKENDIIGKNPVAILTGPQTDKAVLKYMIGQIENNQSYLGDILIYAKDGSKRLHQVIGQPIKGPDGQVTKYFAIGTDITEQRRMENERLQKEVEQQKEITRVILQTQESERNELGRELHDNVNQILGAVKLHLSYCLTHYDKAIPIIEKSINYVHEAIEEIRNLSHKMVMPRFSECTLPHELAKLTANYNYGQTIHLEIAEWTDEYIPTAVKETFFRITQEQLTNIHKHAQADRITIQLRSDKRSAAITIKDNGVGFDPGKKKRGIGITNIFNRVESYNGSTHLISAPGKGCVLLVSIPLNEV